MRINVRVLIVEICYLILIIESFFAIRFFQVADEIIAILSLGYIVLNIGKKKDKILMNLLVFCSAVLIVGILGNMVFQKREDIFVICQDIFIFFKPFLVFYAIYLLLKNQQITDRVILRLNRIITLLVFALLLGLLVGLFFNTQLAHYDIWANFTFLKTYIFFTGYPSVLAGFIVPIVSLLYYVERKIDYRIIILLICAFFTQSGIGFLSIFLLYGLNLIFCFTKKIKWYHAVIIIIGIALVGITEVRNYLLSSSATRAIMLKSSFQLMTSYFPLGVGFSNYGGSVAAKNYSTVYTDLGFNTIWGLGGWGVTGDILDSYFPMIVGQFGIVGLVSVIILVYGVYKTFNRENDIILKMSAAYLLIMTLAICFGQGGFSSALGEIIVITFAIFLKKCNCSKL